MALGVFLDIMGAFDNVTFESISGALREFEIPTWVGQWIDNMLRNRIVQVELHGVTVERELTKGNPQGGILWTV